MKRILQLCLLALLCLGYTWAQDTTQKQMKPGTPQARHDQMAAQHEQMMKGLQADVDSMKANLQKMKAQLGSVKDQSTKDQLQLNITMWQTFIDNMDKHLQMMKSMGGPGHDHGEHGAMGPHDHDHDHEHHGGMATPSPSPKP
jgi:peptidoglycan hydrolase CwlO-like protein